MTESFPNFEVHGVGSFANMITLSFRFRGFFSFEFSDVERLAGKVKGIFGIEIHIS